MGYYSRLRLPDSRIDIMNITRFIVFAFLTVASGTVPARVWQATEPLLTARGGAGVIQVDGRLYAIGGVDGLRFINSAEFTTIRSDGSLAPWQKISALNEERGFFGVAAHGGFIYAVGGGNGPGGHHLLRTVERAAILADGRLGPWQRENAQLNLPRRCAKVTVIGDYLYAFGGFGGTLLDSIERAPLRADGSLGAWELLSRRFTLPRYIHAMAQTDKALYALGGHAEQGGTGKAEVEYALFDGTGEIGPWQAAPVMKQGRYGLAALAHGDYVYAFGGLSGATFYDAVERSRIGADGALSSWESAAPLPAPFADIGVAGYQDWVYVVGGTNREGYFDSVFVARLNAQGDFVDLPAPAAARAPAPAKPVLMPNSGVVVKIIDGGAYSYVEIDTGAGHEWLAAARSELKAGDRVHYSPGIFMENFYSKTLRRRFGLIRFVGKLEKLP
ncbi:MAG TPA: hypothetical protein ENJ19_05050 [Gammaproteobacteria bacterium]|nr:hypothetical protein [Gammaproteobacteria bacterium]